jgi:potassium efflux system protein
LLQLIASERKIIDEMRNVYTNLISQLQQTQQALTALTERFDQEIGNRQKQDLFNRKQNPLASLGWKSINEELSRLAGQVALLVTVDFWLKETQAVWPSGGFPLVAFLLLFGILYFLFLRLCRYCILAGQRPVMSSRPWGSLTLKLIQRSLPLLGATIFLYAYAQVRLVYSSVPLIRVVVYILLIWLFCRWELDLLKMWRKGDKPPALEPLIFRLRVMIIATRAFAIAYVTLAWMIGGGGAILFLCRAFFEVAFLVWSVSFWKMFRQRFPQFSTEKPPLFLTATPIIVG